MGLFSGIKRVVGNVGSAIKKGVVDTGHAVGNVASNPWVQGLTAAGLAATGVGAPLAAGIMAAERGGGALIKPGGNIGQGIKGGVEGAAMGYGASKAGGLVRGVLGAGGAAMPGGGGAATVTDPVVGDGMPGEDSGGGGWQDTLGNLVKGAGSAVVGGVKRALPSAIGGGGGMSGMQAVLAALAAAQAAQAARSSGRAGDLQNKSLDLAERNWGDAAPLRAQGQARLLDPSRPNLSGSFTNPANPFARKRAVVL